MSTSLNLTVTGFGAFQGVERNPSELLVRHLHSMRRDRFRISARVFPVIYEYARQRIETVLSETRPEILLMTGVATGISKLHLEGVARNADQSETPDNRNVVRSSQAILNKDAPDAYVSNLPLERFATELNLAGVPAAVSEDAGGYICNHYYYQARHIQSTVNSSAECLFVHLPALEQFSRPDQATRIAEIAEAVLMLADMIAKHIECRTSTANAAALLNG